MVAPEYYIFTGREVIPDHITHVLIDKALNFVRANAFRNHRNIKEVICHDGVEKIEREAFCNCPSLRRVIMPGVKVIKNMAFDYCKALTYIEGGKLEIIGGAAFQACESLNSIDMSSIKVVESYAFSDCTNLTNANFGKDLKLIGTGAFCNCPSLERITLPLKDGMVGGCADNTFQACVKLNRVDPVGGVHETITALLLDKWKNDMNEEINTINQILPNTPAGRIEFYAGIGEKAQVIGRWITSVRRKIIRYKAEHRSYLNVAATTLQSSLPNEIVHKNILPFLELPSHTFQGETSD